MDSLVLAEMLEVIQESDRDYRSVLVIRNGYIVLEAYTHPYQVDTLHDLASATKSVTSALVGMAIDQGYIEGVDQPVVGFFPHLDIANVDGRKEAMTVEHLLTMKSGMDWPHESTSSVFYEMEESGDWVQFVLDRPTSTTPGDYFNYNSGGSHLLSAIVQESTRVPSLEFAKTHLFEPLGISDVVWPLDPSGVAIGGWGLQMTPRDMAKFGYLYLSNGTWDGRPIVPAEWVSASIEEHSDRIGWGGPGYGYQWWLASWGGYSAAGGGGQTIHIVPEQEIVVVFTSAINTVHTYLVDRYILGAVESSDPLPANPQGVAHLESLVAQMGRPPDPKPVPTLPDTAQEVSGKTFDIEENQVELRAIGLSFAGREAIFGFTLEDFIGETVSEVRVGLDDVPRMTPGEHPWNRGSTITWASKGYWPKEDTFLLELSIVGSPFRHEVRITFDQRGGVIIQDRDMVSMRLTLSYGVIRD